MVTDPGHAEPIRRIVDLDAEGFGGDSRDAETSLPRAITIRGGTPHRASCNRPEQIEGGVITDATLRDPRRWRSLFRSESFDRIELGGFEFAARLRCNRTGQCHSTRAPVRAVGRQGASRNLDSWTATRLSTPAPGRGRILQDQFDRRCSIGRAEF